MTALQSNSALGAYLRSFGPGILGASAAIGGSHLVASTQAGALYGWALASFILAVNLLKYPFFLAGSAYTVYAGESLVAGYGRLGKGYVCLLWALEVFGGITSVAACCAFSAAIVRFVFPSLSMPAACAAVMAAAVLVILFGRYRLLSAVSKALVALLSLITILAVAVYAGEAPAGPGGAAHSDLSPWTFASLGFLVMTAGWMPCPLDLSAIQSVWVTCQQRREGVTARGLFFDFNLSYAATALLAVVFLALGALMMHASGQVPAKNGAAFTAQLIGMYETAVGSWSRPFLALMAFACIWGTTITVLDGYARVIGVCQQHIRGLPEDPSSSAFAIWVLIQ
ncbi:MAG: hypothetical protein ACI4SY_03960, partial [Sutterella sp.]